jgi:hypothetical protein
MKLVQPGKLQFSVPPGSSFAQRTIQHHLTLLRKADAKLIQDFISVLAW